MPSKENPHAGQGPVVLDIGGDIGALIVAMPAEMQDLEVEIIPSGTDTRPSHSKAVTHQDAGAHRHDHDGPGPHVHHHHHDEDAAPVSHDDAHGHTHGAGAPPHVAVVARPLPDGSVVHSLVFGELSQGSYDLYVRPDGPVRLTAAVVGGEITQAVWPAENS